jgi:hypothetical protein
MRILLLLLLYRLINHIILFLNTNNYQKVRYILFYFGLLLTILCITYLLYVSSSAALVHYLI